MNFFDANILYGVSSEKRMCRQAPDTAALQQKLKEFGISRAIVRREEQFHGAPAAANKMLSDDVRQTDNLWGVWTMLPPHCNETPPPDKILSEMKADRIVGWQFFPGHNKYQFHWRVLKLWLAMAEKNNIPLFIDFAFVPERDLLEVMDRFPALTVILRNASVWPSDRILRPFLAEFPNAYMELSNYLVPGGLEDLAANGFSGKILFSTRFHAAYAGGAMMMLKHANISEKDKPLIAAGNLERILGRISHDK
jgi:predicted TIM-barrel fold metal-dependent hydrolase